MHVVEIVACDPLAVSLCWERCTPSGPKDSPYAAVAGMGLYWSASVASWSWVGQECMPAGQGGKYSHVVCAGDVPAALAADDRVSPQGQAMLHALGAYVAGGDVRWPELVLSMDGLSPFSATVLDILRTRVPAGRTVTYGQLAAMAGSPRAARGVGRILARNRWPLLVPCHRVVGSGGRLVGFSGTGGVEMKRYLLELEGATRMSL